MAEKDAMISSNEQDLTKLWDIHQAAEWPAGVGFHEGELMTLDTVVSGCVTYYFEEHELDPQRVAILEDCLSDLEAALPELTEEPLDYFQRLFPTGQTVGRIAPGGGSPVMRRVGNNDRCSLLAMASVVLCFILSTGSGATAAEFTFVALGDMPYGPREQAYPAFEALIAEINRRAPVFTFHLGDTKSGLNPCSDELLLEQRDFMNSFASALVYTPGDNEWTDCHRLLAGAYDPLDRLRFIREHYFPTALSLGGRPIRLERQADVMPGFEVFVENSRFNWKDVWFVTAHVVGSNNNFEAVEGSDATAEFLARDEANRVWLADSFDKAEAAGADAVVVAIHADMFGSGFDRQQETFAPYSGFKNFAETLVRKAQFFRKRVFLLFGDSHEFRVFQPFPRSAGNLTAVEVYGAELMHAVEVTVDPDTEGVFTVKPVRNPAIPAPVD